MEPLLDEQKASEVLTVKVKTLQAWRVRGDGPNYIKLGRCVRYRLSDLEEFAASHTRRSTSDQGEDIDDARL